MEKFDQQIGGFKAVTHIFALANSLIAIEWLAPWLRWLNSYQNLNQFE